MSPITTHILDTSRGQPAEGVAIVLHQQDDEAHWQQVGEGVTDEDGRLTSLLDPGELTAGCYRITFATGDYHARHGVTGFYPTVTIEFQVTAADEHYHVPLLLNPFGYSTYRGS
jgi:5-hydroxyisourate hydrolase